jgi:hypothetical protein
MTRAAVAVETMDAEAENTGETAAAAARKANGDEGCAW